MATLAEVHHTEMELLMALRTSNESRFSTADDCDALSVCVCQKPPSGAMVRCELCRDLFHSGCMQLERSEPEYGEAWFCPFCQRSRKPPLDKVLPLLASLQRIRVRLPEGDALRFLIERTVRWQHKVQQACTDGLLERLGKGRGSHRLPSRLDWEHHGSPFYTEHASLPLYALPSELDELLVEGFLLQVTLPETEQLHRYLLYKLSPPPAPSPKHSPVREHHHKRSPQHGKNGGSSPSKENGQSKRTKKRKESSDSQLSEKAKKSRKKKSKKSRERREERSERREESRRSSCSPVHTSDPAASESEEDYSLCAAPWCREPEGDEVNWVQCDGSCNQWFHQVCVGLSAERAESEDYICISCTQPNYERDT